MCCLVYGLGLLFNFRIFFHFLWPCVPLIFVKSKFFIVLNYRFFDNLLLCFCLEGHFIGGYFVFLNFRRKPTMVQFLNYSRWMKIVFFSTFHVFAIFLFVPIVDWNWTLHQFNIILGNVFPWAFSPLFSFVSPEKKRKW